MSGYDRAVITSKSEITVDIDTAVAAEWFAHLSDEQQADFFIEVAKIAKDWGHGWQTQFYLAARHLVTCECSTDEARELVRAMADGIKERQPA